MEGKIDCLWRNEKKDEYLGSTIRGALEGEALQLGLNLFTEKVSKMRGWKRIIDILYLKYG